MKLTDDDAMMHLLIVFSFKKETKRDKITKKGVFVVLCWYHIIILPRTPFFLVVVTFFHLDKIIFLKAALFPINVRLLLVTKVHLLEETLLSGWIGCLWSKKSRVWSLLTSNALTFRFFGATEPYAQAKNGRFNKYSCKALHSVDEKRIGKKRHQFTDS